MTGLGHLARAAPSASRFRGANVIETPNAPFGSQAAAASLRELAAIGANAVAIVPFFWQPGPDSPDIVYGDALPVDRLRKGIDQARAAGLRVIIKPHVWIPGHWAGDAAMRDQADWRRWFGAYATLIGDLASLADGEDVAGLAIGTELAGATRHPGWEDIIAEVRRRYNGPVTYVAHGTQEAQRVAFWEMLDAVSVSLYPVLGGAHDRAGWAKVIAEELQRSQAVADGAGKPCWIAEFGIRSARDATLRPWESAEEREAAPDARLQAAVIEAWLRQMDRHRIDAALVWRWFTDPGGGGSRDTDFTVQRKPASAVLRRYWLRT